jgi:hypothetical protein
MRRFAFLLTAVLALAMAGSAAAQVCPPGSSSPTGSAPCSPCAAGFFAPSFGMTSCLACPPGSFSAPGSAVCSVCPAGYFSGAGSAFCTPCPAGFYSAAGSGTCTPCPPGFISASPGSGQCTPCPPGYAPNATRTACVEQSTPALPTTWGRLKITYR